MQTTLVETDKRDTFLRDLFEKAKTNPCAFKELGQIASGRIDLPLARDLFNELENVGQTEEVLSHE